MRDVLFVSKPVVPPWNDGSKNIVRDLSEGLGSWNAVVPPKARRSNSFAPSLADHARMFLQLMLRRRPSVMHFVFAPNPRSSRAATFVVRARRVPSVHTVASAPREFDARLLFADVTVVLSRETERRFVDAGTAPDRLQYIPAPLARVPQVEKGDARRLLSLPSSVPILLFPGDLELGGGADLALSLVSSLSIPEFVLVMACRRKGPRSEEAERRLRARVHEAPGRRVIWFGDTPKIQELLAASDLVVMPAETVVAKTDHPLVLLESLMHGTPVVVSDRPPLAELVDSGGAVATELTVDALAERVESLLADSDGREAMGRQGQRYVERVHRAETVAKRYEAVYERVCGLGGC